MVDGRVYLVYVSYGDETDTDTMHVISMKIDGSDEKEEANFSMNCHANHQIAVSKDRVFFSNDDADTMGGCDGVYVMKLDGSDKKKIFEANGGVVDHIAFVNDRVVIAASDCDDPHYTFSVWDYYVTTMKQDGSDAKKIVNSSEDWFEIIGANKGLVYLKSGEKYFSVPVAGGEKTELKLPDSYERGVLVFGMDDHVVFLDGDTSDLSCNVGSAKADGSDYVEYFTGEDSGYFGRAGSYAPWRGHHGDGPAFFVRRLPWVGRGLLRPRRLEGDACPRQTIFSTCGWRSTRRRLRPRRGRCRSAPLSCVTVASWRVPTTAASWTWTPRHTRSSARWWPPRASWSAGGSRDARST